MSPPLPPPPTEEELPDITSHEQTPPGDGCYGNRDNGCPGDSTNESTPEPEEPMDMPKSYAMNKLASINPKYTNTAYQQLVRPHRIIPQTSVASPRNGNGADYEVIQMDPMPSTPCDNTTDNNNHNNDAQTQGQGQTNESFDTSTSSGESGMVDGNESSDKIDDPYFKDMVIKHKTLV